MKKALLLIFLGSLLSFTAMSQCGQISIIGEFNGWAGDVNMVQDTANADIWYGVLNLNKESNTENAPDTVELKFREDASWTVNWGAHTFPTGVGTQDGANIPVPLDTAALTTNYFVTFNCSTGEFSFMRTSVTATRAYNIMIDGVPDEAEWDMSYTVTRMVFGTPNDDINTVNFGVAYDDDSLYVALSILDAIPTYFDMGEIFIDGDNSGGAYDAHDLHLRFVGPYATIVQGPQDLQTHIGFAPTLTGYTAEIAIPLAPFGIVPSTDLEIGFDLISGDDDTNPPLGSGVQYMMAWAGNMANYVTTSTFGKLVFADFAGVKEIEQTSAKVALYPNPSSDDIYLEVADNTFNGAVTVSVNDMTGRQVMLSNENLRINSRIHLKVDQLSSGIYFVNIIGENGKKAVKKLIVE